MEKPENDPFALHVYHCPVCRGLGVTGTERCRSCKGAPVVAWQNGFLLRWGLPIDTAHLRQRRFTAVADHAVLTLLLCFSALGIGSLAKLWYDLNQRNTPIWLFFRSESVLALIFWASLFVDSYLVYAFALELAKIRHLPRRASQERENFGAPSGWEEAQRIPRVRQLDAARFFSGPAIRAVEKSWELARRANHAVVAPVHLLVALLGFPAMGELFVRLGISFDQLKRRIATAVSQYAVPNENALAMNREFYQALYHAYAEAWTRQQKKVDLPELLVGCVRSSELVSDVLYDLDVDEEKITNVAVWFRLERRERQRHGEFRRQAAYRPKHAGVNRAMTAVATRYLDRFSEDLTLLAKFGRLEPCLGRDQEMAEIFRIMAAGGRDSVVLVGNPGVGKRAIVNGIASRMVADDVPRMLRDKRLVSLQTAKIISGVSAAEAEERLLHCLYEAARSGNIILFINDVTKMIGVSAGGAAALDLAGVLAQALQQTGLRAVTTALPADFSRYLENHTLGQMLEKINVEEPDGSAAIQILESLAGPIEARYRVFFTYEAIASTVQLSQRYLHERYLPEKAIEVMEETAIAVVNTKGSGAAVTGQDIARTVSGKTSIPLTEVTAEESEKLLNLEEAIHRRVVGQEEAVKTVSAAIRRSRAELRDAKRPIVNLLFLGPTGVGKTELAKTVAAVYFGAASEFVRLDMSEYQEKSSVSRLLGAPAGVDGASGGYLTEAVRRHPFALVLLDEIEKAHPDILNLFLQVMDDGRLTDAAGRTIDFTNVILIATSNACTPTIQQKVRAGVAVETIKDELLRGELMQSFRPELLNRFDSIVVFKPLGMPEVRQITRLLLGEVAERLAAKGIMLEPTDAAIDEIAAAGFDPEFGARPLRRVIQDRVDDPIATRLLRGEVSRRDTLVLDVGGAIAIRKPTRR